MARWLAPAKLRADRCRVQAAGHAPAHERSRSQRLPLREFGLGLVKCAQAVLPLDLEPTRNKTVVGVDSTIAPLGALRLVTRALNRQTPLCERAIMIGFEALCCCKSRLNTKRRERGEDRARDHLIDLRCADARAIDAATVCDGLAGAVIAAEAVRPV